MKKHLLLATMAFGAVTVASAQTRYLDDTFSGVEVTSDIVFGQNYYFIPLQGSPVNPADQGAFPPLGYNPVVGDLKLRLYEPDGDTDTDRSLIILLHSGNFLPRYRNQGTTGDIGDSSIVELANRFAKKGYVVATPRYRLGWNPLAGTQVLRTQQLLNAVYRAIHDAQTAVRFFKKEAATYKVNPHKIILVGVGSGGYVVNAYATLDKTSETEIEKFQDEDGNSVINAAVYGDINGQGGTWNQYNHAGFSNKVAATVNIGGALGDISWLEAGDAPMIGFHTWKDPFAPYDSGMVIVPTTGQNVVRVHGTRTMIKKAVELGNNALLVNHTFSDAYSTRAYSLNAKAQYEGLYEFRLPMTSASREEGSPWDWWDSATVVTGAQLYGMTPTEGTGLHNTGVGGSEGMSATKGRLYIDTIIGFAAPRLYQAVITQNLSVSENSVASSEVKLFPNPVAADFSITVNSSELKSVSILDMTGKVINTWNNINGKNVTISRDGIAAGLYLVKVKTSKEEIVRQVIFK